MLNAFLVILAFFASTLLFVCQGADSSLLKGPVGSSFENAHSARLPIMHARCVQDFDEHSNKG